MRFTRAIAVGLTLFGITALPGRFVYSADSPPNIATLSVPVAGPVEIIFHGDSGPFLVQKRDSLDAAAVWTDVPGAVITELQPGVFMGLLPTSKTLADLAFYRVLSQSSGEVLNGWTVLMNVSRPANGNFFVKGESATVTVTLLDTMAQNLTPPSFASLNLYMYGPQEPEDTVTATKLLNASTIRTNKVHHYIDLKTNPGAKLSGNVISYQLQPVSDEDLGTYNIAVYAVLASDGTQQLMKFSSVQIGTSTIEAPVVTKTQCASCHEGPVSGKVYMHHIDPGFSPAGNWALDYQPVTSCKACHNQNGYAAYTDATGAKVPDPIVRRVHGVHRGADLKLPFNTNSTTGDFKDYTHVEFPADQRNCTACHVDDRWKTEPSMLACGACHDNTWFGPKPSTGRLGSAQRRCAIRR